MAFISSNRNEKRTIVQKNFSTPSGSPRNTITAAMKPSTVAALAGDGMWKHHHAYQLADAPINNHPNHGFLQILSATTRNRTAHADPNSSNCIAITHTSAVISEYSRFWRK